MNKKAKDISALLDRPHFQAAGENLTPPDPAIPTRIRVTLDQLEAYNDNPRLSRNPNYDDIKESIRNRGLDHTPNITRQLPTKPYMIKDGGNTRLAILNELWLETQDRRFFELDCLFYPWTSDLDVLVGHMVENEARGSMLFIERALAAMKTKHYLEEQDGKKISTNELSKRITKLGWSVDQSNLGQLLYAHDTLFPVIPNAFWGSMGRDGVKKIRKILDNARTFWNSVATQDEGDFDSIWQTVFTAEDSETFDIAGAQNKLEAEIAQRLSSPMMAVRGEIQAIAQGISPGGVRPSNVLITPNKELNVGTNTNISPAGKLNSNNKTTSLPTKPQIDLKAAQNIVEKSVEDIQIPPTSNDVKEAEFIHHQPTTQISKSALSRLLTYSSEELMNNVFGLAIEYATHFGFESCVALPSAHAFSGHEGFHSGFVLLQPSKVVEAAAFANPNVYLNYLYLFQLSNWFCLDHDDPAMQLVSVNGLHQWIAKEDIEHASRSIIHMRAYSAAMHLQSSTEGRAFGVMDELETCIGILIGRFAAHIGQGV